MKSSRSVRNFKITLDYKPYGIELEPVDNDTTNPNYKYTGQERDIFTNYDYMHFRYYGSTIGRFFKPDNTTGSPMNPQNWNLYSYVRGNPVNYLDPTGHIVSLAKLPQPIQEQLIEELNALTGNKYKVNAAGQLELVSVGENSSKYGTEKLNEWIASPTQYEIVAKQATKGNKEEDIICGKAPDEPPNEIWLDPRDFNFKLSLTLGYSNEQWQATLGIASAFIHEMFHRYDKLPDAPAKGKAPRGTAEGELNVIREERGLPVNISGHEPVSSFDIRGNYFQRTFEANEKETKVKTYYVGRY
ncbi:MAG: RHS repeat-associated core domain-containing protein [Candidatus Methanofastidiosa archaeon]|nr:RHS repeat-associated core domain-containing protein [Candidatus Methanofastidiosa archaeon]